MRSPRFILVCRLQTFMWKAAGLLCAALLGTVASAAPSDLDPAYNNSGRILSQLGDGSFVRIASVIVQPNGRHLFVGTCTSTIAGDGTNVRQRICLARFRGNSLSATWVGDTQFGISGTSFGTSQGRLVTAAKLTFDNEANSAALQPDGKIVVAGRCGYTATISSLCAFRFNENGIPDASFGPGDYPGAALYLTASGVNNSGVKVLIQPDGKIVLVGTCDERFCLIRLLANGLPDPSFNGGLLTRMPSTTTEVATGAVSQASGFIVVAGYCNIGINQYYCVRRFLPSGEPDATTANGWLIPTPANYVFRMGTLTSGAQPSAGIVEYPNGKLMIGGFCTPSGSTTTFFCTLRLNADGSPDLTWAQPGENGRYERITPTFNVMYSMSVTDDGKLLAVGVCQTPEPAFRICAMRHHATGELDRSFGSAGITVFDASGASVPNDVGYATTMDLSQRHVIAGKCGSGSTSQLCAIRLESGPFGFSTCSMDIDGDGVVSGINDALLYRRVAQGMSGDAVIGGIGFPPGARRTTWPQIRDFLGYQCGMRVRP
jgi:uncharacterized delta-60 repeat protein